MAVAYRAGVLGSLAMGLGSTVVLCAGCGSSSHAPDSTTPDATSGDAESSDASDASIRGDTTVPGDADAPVDGSDARDSETPNPNPQPVPTAGAGLLQATLTVSTQYNGSLPPTFVGLSVEKQLLNTYPNYTLSASNAAAVRIFKTLAPSGSTLRIGASSTDRTDFDPDGGRENPGVITPAGIHELVGFLGATGWSVLYAVNLGGMAPTGNDAGPLRGTMYPTSPEKAAAEVAVLVREMQAQLGPGWAKYLTGIEIGNEPDLFGQHAGGSYCVACSTPTCATQPCDDSLGTWSENDGSVPFNFEETWEALRTAIVEVGADAGVTIPMTGPADAEHLITWVGPFAQHKGGEIELLTQHYYRLSPTSEPGVAPDAGTMIDELLTTDRVLQGPNPDPVPPNDQRKSETTDAGYLATLASYAGGVNPTIGYGLTEANSVAGGGQHGVSDAYGSALWAIDFLFTSAQGYAGGQPSGGRGAAVVNITTGGNGKGGSNWYTPIADDSRGGILGVLPIYYGMMFIANHCATGTLETATLTIPASPALGASAYAVKSATGEVDLVLTNADPGHHDLQVSATLPGSFTTATLIELTQGPGGAVLPDLSAAPPQDDSGVYDIGVNIQGQKVELDAGYTPGAPYALAVVGGNTLKFYVPALSAVLVKLE
jgi:hypothetical protein